MNMGLNNPIHTPSQFNKNDRENASPLTALAPSKSILFEFKSRLEIVEQEFDEAKSEIERLKKRKGELETNELGRKADIGRLNSLNNELKKNYHYELEKVSNLNEVILNLRNEIKSTG